MWQGVKKTRLRKKGRLPGKPGGFRRRSGGGGHILQRSLRIQRRIQFEWTLRPFVSALGPPPLTSRSPPMPPCLLPGGRDIEIYCEIDTTETDYTRVCGVKDYKLGARGCHYSLRFSHGMRTGTPPLVTIIGGALFYHLSPLLISRRRALLLLCTTRRAFPVPRVYYYRFPT